MCNWFSAVTKGNGKLIYFNKKQRALIYAGEILKNDHCEIGSPSELDSHSAICAFFGLDCDKVNKYEFRPLDRKFKTDQINNKTDDSVLAKKNLCRLNYQLLAPPQLKLKKIINPFSLSTTKVSQADIKLLMQWASVRESVRDSVWDSVCASVWDSVRASVRESVWDSVWDSVRESVWDSVWASVWASVRDSVWDSVCASVRESVWDSVWDSVRDSVWDSVWDSVCASVRESVRESVWDSVCAYLGSFFILETWKYIQHDKGVYPFQSVVDLWEKGIIPSFDGTIWRLHGHNGAVIKEVKL